MLPCSAHIHSATVNDATVLNVTAEMNIHQHVFALLTSWRRKKTDEQYMEKRNGNRFDGWLVGCRLWFDFWYDKSRLPFCRVIMSICLLSTSFHRHSDIYSLRMSQLAWTCQNRTTENNLHEQHILSFIWQNASCSFNMAITYSYSLFVSLVALARGFHTIRRICWWIHREFSCALELTVIGQILGNDIFSSWRKMFEFNSNLLK